MELYKLFSADIQKYTLDQNISSMNMKHQLLPASVPTENDAGRTGPTTNWFNKITAPDKQKLVSVHMKQNV